MGTILGSTWPSTVMLIEEYSMNFTLEARKNYFSIIGIGGSIGALPAGKVAHLIGHRYSMVLSELFIVSGWASLIVADAVWKLNTGRMLQGIGIGALCAVIPSYVGEISQPHTRGMYKCLMTNAYGIVVVCVILHMRLNVCTIFSLHTCGFCRQIGIDISYLCLHRNFLLLCLWISYKCKLCMV